jgi:hypothetical protein
MKRFVQTLDLKDYAGAGEWWTEMIQVYHLG